MKNKFSIAMSLAVMVTMLVTSFALAAELVTAELAGTANDVTVTQGSNALFTIDVYATGSIDCDVDSANPSTATVDTAYSISAGGVVTAGTPSDALNFFSNGTPVGGSGNCGTTWTDAPTHYSVSASVSAAATTPTGAYTISLSPAAGTTDPANPSDAATGKLGDATATSITVHVVAPVVTDGTPPVITKIISGTAGTNGWYTSNVTVAWSVTDPDSAVVIDSGCGSQSFTSETAGTPSSCTAHSAGGSASDSVNVKIDKTAPTASASALPAPDANGWNNTNVTVSFSGSDGLSGIDSCSAPVVLSSDGVNQSASGTCTDKAGNVSATATASGINIDKTAPTASASALPAPNGNGWNNTNVTVSFSGSDGLSGIDSCSAPVVLSSEAAGQSASGDCTDKAGNVSSTATASGINIDKTKPTISAAISAGTLGLNGWYVSDVTVQFTCADALSGAVGCPADQLLNTEGLAVSSTAQTVMDAAGNTSDASNVVSVKIDKTAPTITWNGGPADNGNYDFGFVPGAPTCTANDTPSGPNGCLVIGYSNLVGTHTMTATAYDMAGNSKIETRTYSVAAWDLRGFYQPVDMNDVYNVVKNGSTVPLKFEIFTMISGVEITNTIGITLTTVEVACNSSAPIDDIETTATGGTSLRYDATGGQFIFNWQTPKPAAGRCYRVTMTAGGSSLVAFFRLK